MTCEEAIGLMGEYLEATLGRTVGADLERHLDACDECAVYLRTYRKTRELVAGAGRAEMPAVLRARLREFLLARLSALDTTS